MQEIIELLTAAGFVADGKTAIETVRVPTVKAPIGNRGKSGGVLRTFGGRLRFVRSDGLKVTVGERSIYFWRPMSARDQCGEKRFHTDVAYFKTSERDAIAKHLAGPAEPGTQRK